MPADQQAAAAVPADQQAAAAVPADQQAAAAVPADQQAAAAVPEQHKGNTAVPSLKPQFEQPAQASKVDTTLMPAMMLPYQPFSRNNSVRRDKKSILAQDQQDIQAWIQETARMLQQMHSMNAARRHADSEESLYNNSSMMLDECESGWQYRPAPPPPRQPKQPSLRSRPLPPRPPSPEMPSSLPGKARKAKAYGQQQLPTTGERDLPLVFMNKYKVYPDDDEEWPGSSPRRPRWYFLIFFIQLVLSFIFKPCLSNLMCFKLIQVFYFPISA